MNTELIASRNCPDNFVVYLQSLAKNRPTDTALIIVDADGNEFVDRQFNYTVLDSQVKALAAVLQERFEAGERALLLMENDEHYVIGFLACLYAGVIAVPVFPPESIREQHLARLLTIAADAKAQCILTTSMSLALIDNVANTQLESIEILLVDTVEQDSTTRWSAHIPEGDDIAFLQYTSGSTSSPKGVMVSHHNLMVNAKAFEEMMSINANDIFVSWLPLYHDLGLIGGLLQPIYQGIPAILMTPKFFIERPMRWLEVISKYRATVSCAPNFAFQLCVERARDSQLQKLDLSTWRVALCGAEPVRRSTMSAFTERFRSVNFSGKAIYPCYGLAEATLVVTGGVTGRGMIEHEFSPELLAQGKAEVVAQGIPIVACGSPTSNHAIKIVNPQELVTVANGIVGEIWATGASLTQGYWQRPQETAATFLQKEDKRWLRTGDLGFIHERQLYIMGRLKDLIIIRGQNIYPQDVELIIEEEVEIVRKGRVAAFTVEYNDAEGIGVAVEVSRNTQRLVTPEVLVEALSAATSTSFHEPLSVVVLLNPGALPKTSSGKLQRSACRQGWRERTLDAYAIYEYGHFVQGESQPSSKPLMDETERAVAIIWETVLDRTGIGHEANFLAMGGNSLKVVQAAARISDQWRIPFTPRNLFQHSRLNKCAAEIRHLLSVQTSSLSIGNRILPISKPAEGLPLSYGQQRLWLLWQLDPTSSAYHIQHAVRLSGSLDRKAFHASVQGLIRRHESLRTIFRTSMVGVEQVIQSASSLVITDIDLCGLADLEREQKATEEAQRIIAQPFDLIQGPLLRIALIEMTERENILVIVMHHIISDGASIQIFLDELAVLYQAHAHRNGVSLNHLPIQYSDYALWQIEWLEAGEKNRQLAYWQNYLGKQHPVLLLPADHARQSVTSYPAARHRFDLPLNILTELRQLALNRGATLFMTLMTAFQVLLFRHTGQEDIRIGVPIANRNRVETNDLIGFFVNTQVIRSQLHGRMLMTELLDQVRDDMITAQAYRDLPFEQLVETLQPQRDLHRNPLFQVTLNHLQRDYRIFQQFSGLVATEYFLPEQAAQLEFRLETVELPDGNVSANFIYASGLFEQKRIERMMRHFIRILQISIASPEISIHDIDLLDDEDKGQLKAWGSNMLPASGHQPVHQFIECQAERCPEMEAVISDQLTLSYAELNRRANRLAHRLISLGIKPETRVGVAIERGSAELVLGLLAILKAGGAYLPLDPEYPIERLDYMVEDGGINFLLTQSHFKKRLPYRESMEIIELDSIDLSKELETNPEIALHDDNLAYVIYTSGSTGRPKGVSIAHGPLVRHLSAIQKVYDVQAGDRELMFFSINFDAAAEQWMTPLTVGATLVLSSTNQLAGKDFVDLIEKYQITILHLPPAYLRLLLPMIDNKQHRIRTCIAGGEAWYTKDVMAAWALFRDTRLVNAYGPTETVITPTAWIGYASEHAFSQSMGEYAPIGRPIGVRDVYVLDEDLNLVPPGTMGELYIGGKSLARGYLNRPTLTSERFVADPFDEIGGRLYRTGDLVRWRSDGQLEYLGRLDHQIKLRGFRIELGEIEAQLLAQTGIREAVVLPQEGRQGLRLIAYITICEGVQQNESLLKMALASTLPNYMIPSSFVFLSSLPLNPNGKIDRTALPAPEQLDESEYDRPVDVIEVMIAEIWAQALEIPQVGLHNNFFDLGGHSLLLIRIKQELETRLNKQIAMVDLFKYTTVASLAKFLSQGEMDSAALSLSRLQQRAQRQRSTFMQRKQKIGRIN